jgi:hypothetical protein
MNLKKYIPSTVEVVKITIIVVVLAVTGAGAYLVANANKLLKRS